MVTSKYDKGYWDGFRAAITAIENSCARYRDTLDRMAPVEEAPYGSEFCNTIYSCAGNPQGLMGTA
jgi:hypothetical protein